MKKTTIILGFLFGFGLLAAAQAEIEVPSSVTKVTVYSAEALVEHTATVDLQPGQATLRLTGLSPYLKQESIRIGGNGTFAINNVGFQKDHLAQLDGTPEGRLLKETIEKLSLEIEGQKLRVRILDEKIAFLNANRSLTSNERSLGPEELRQFIELYGNNIEKLLLKKHLESRAVNKMEEELELLEAQLEALSGKADLPSGTILASVDSKASATINLSFSYLVSRARWFPSYDLRFQGVDKPILITFKANISQDTGVDWQAVDLMLSTAKTSTGSVIPELETFWLDFKQEDIAALLQGRAAGVNLTGPAGASDHILIRGAGAALASTSPLYVVDGFVVADANHIDPSRIKDISVLKGSSATALYGSRAGNGVIVITTQDGDDSAFGPRSVAFQNETSVEFLVDAPQTIHSNNKPNVVTFKEETIAASFEYRAAPKLSGNVFLVANVVDWFARGILDGEANVFFENTYTGKSMINTSQLTDTLLLSLGVDNALGVKREKTKDYTSRRFLGSTQTDTFGFRITVMNNKQVPVIVKVEDQIPVSKNREIQVSAVQLSGGNLDEESGLVEWNVSLNPGETKELLLQYSVRYPRNRQVNL